MTKTISKVGNSHGIIFDTALMDLARVKAGDQVTVTIHEGGSIILTPVRPAIGRHPAPIFGVALIAIFWISLRILLHVEQGKGEKLIIFKYKPKVRYRRKTGHRQSVTRVRVGDIVGPE